ncbi:epidermal growth factor receptor substrate 15-like 1 [Ornithodoros turicata]|uniref:epidermal growth factor receptor substrate 15-like 1 n=1 Tax=Ornithodoros turicata TaxID=34597 RepID=UPI003139BA0A
MASLPSISQIAGVHSTAYEAFYQQVDPAGIDHVGALEAAAFLKRSGLPDTVLSKIWDMADSGVKGYLDKQGFFVALKLVALVQNGKPLSTAGLLIPVPAPIMNEPTNGGVVYDWSIKPLEHTKYVEMFNSLGPLSGKLPGTKVKPVMMNSKLPVDVLGRIWDLSDVDQDGALDEDEFIVAMHLVYKALDNYTIPHALPPELVPNSKKSKPSTVLPDFIPDTPTSVKRRPSTPLANTMVDVAAHNALNDASSWVVTRAEKLKYDQLFVTVDTDKDGIVSGLDVRDVFLKTGLPQAVLAQIWNLSDVKQNGCLNSEQFALAMHFVSEKLNGMPLPVALTPEMMPPSLRPKPSVPPPGDVLAGAPVDHLGSPPSSGNKDLEMISEEIKTLRVDKTRLEQEIVQSEADLKARTAELKGLEVEIDSMSAMLKQLDTQKKEAQKRLSDLSAQRAVVDRELAEARQLLEEENNKVVIIRKEVEQQAKVLEEQEHQLQKKREELQELSKEENVLRAEVDSKKANLQALTQTQQETQLQISHEKARKVQMEEQQIQVQTWISQLDRAIAAGDPSLVPESLLRDDHLLHEPEYQQLSNTEGSSPTSFVSAPEEEAKEDPFKSKDPLNDMNGFLGDPFAGEDPFKAVDPFKATVADDPFGGDPFKSVFEPDPKATDYFAAGFPEQEAVVAKDPFDPFGTSNASSAADASAPFDDPFGTDPFAPPAPRSSSPTPALPPKKSKNPPPRPAPPKHLTGKVGPTRAAPAPPLPPADPFASTSEGNATAADEGFANFANFDNC